MFIHIQFEPHAVHLRNIGLGWELFTPRGDVYYNPSLSHIAKVLYRCEGHVSLLSYCVIRKCLEP